MLKIPRPTHTKEWIDHPNLSIHLKTSYNIWYGSTDNNGNPYTKIRAYVGKNATVIQGDHKIMDQSIFVNESFRIWSCKVYAAGKVSSIGIKNEVVTVIIHS